MLFTAILLLTGGTNMLKMDSIDENENEDGENNSKFRENEAKSNSSSLQNSHSLNASTTCTDNWNKKTEHPHSCTNYYKCEKGSLVLFECENGKIFDPEKSECSDSAVCKRNLEPEIIDPCAKQQDGLYPNHNESCQTYYRCQANHKVGSQSCPIGHAFSVSHQSCIPQHLVSCVQPFCDHEENEFYWLPGSYCRSYYYCENGTSLMYSCPEGKMFDRVTKDCRTGVQCFEPICAGKPDGNHPDTTHDCRRSIQCVGGVLRTVTACPTGQRHDGKMCQQESLVTCDDPIKTAVLVEAIHDDCNGYSDGPHVIAETNCRRYQVCQDGKALARLQCPVEQIFNGQQCLPASDVQCDTFCDGKTDGYHADLKEGCRKYNYCRLEKIIERRSCPEGSLFSGRMCLPSPLVNCQQLNVPLQNPCLGLSDGFHADYINGCTNYHYCSGYNVVLRATCIKNTVWNGKQCISAKETLCDKPEPSSDCNGRRTGLYQDKASQCTKYFYCHNGNKTLLACPRGRIFDGESCVNEDEYVCPGAEPDSCYNKTDGYRIEDESGCRAYYYCSNNDKITYICPHNQVFNGTDCTSPQNFQCPYKSTDCHMKENGYYPLLSTLCRKYYFCHNGSKLTTIDCGARKVFDGTKCVYTPQPSVVCKNAVAQPNCSVSSKPEQDLESNCRKYHYCIGNRRQTASCPEDRVFNGNLCVPQNAYTCPKQLR